MRGSIIIVLFFCAGLLAGLNGFSLTGITSTDPSVYALYLLMFLVGIGIGADSHVWSVLKRMNFEILLVPVIIIIGTLTGTAICSIFFNDLSLADSLAIGSGFGYYSLSSIIISKIRNETLGVMALISNISREIFTLIATPLLARYFGKLAPIASGGATSMDTTLPVIAKFSGKEYAVIAVFSGVVLTILVPFIITLIYRII
ncbi:MAG TPA: lysine exporter LysO family protein [Spirochaetota bacterium]|nr:lysine exporter LysO family protein [Spirochaetota bacterium]HPJ33240.1 lysine exporter LysO family protein [Spirochaetota bacterium]